MVFTIQNKLHGHPRRVIYFDMLVKHGEVTVLQVWLINKLYLQGNPMSQVVYLEAFEGEKG